MPQMLVRLVDDLLPPFHLSLTVMLSFSIRCSVFQNTSIVSCISNEYVTFRAVFAFG